MIAFDRSFSEKELPGAVVLGGVFSSIFFLYVFSYVFEGATRYVLASLHLGGVLYLRDLLPVAIIFLLIYGWSNGKRCPIFLLVFCWVLAVHALIGYYYQNTFLQQLFGLKVFFPFLLGVSLAHADLRGLQKFKYFIWLIFVFSCVGVFFNYYVRMPWEGEDFVTSFGITEQTRVWTSGGVRRLAGFARASFDAASAIMISSIVIFIVSKNWFGKIIVAVIGVFAIALTTTKGAMLAACITFAVVGASVIYSRFSILRLFIVLVSLLVVFFPVVAIAIDIRQADVPAGLWWWMSSFADRMETMWPRAFDLWINEGSFLLGRGPGGIGVSQAYGDWFRLNAGDNFFVYWTVVFGVSGWLYLGSFYVYLMANSFLESDRVLLVYGLLLAILTYGLTLNVIEQPILAMSLGYCVANVMRGERR